MGFDRETSAAVGGPDQVFEPPDHPRSLLMISLGVLDHGSIAVGVILELVRDRLLIELIRIKELASPYHCM